MNKIRRNDRQYITIFKFFVLEFIVKHHFKLRCSFPDIKLDGDSKAMYYAFVNISRIKQRPNQLQSRAGLVRNASRMYNRLAVR